MNKEKILNEIDNYWNRNTYNNYAQEDFKEFCKELERKYDCEINRVSHQIKFN